MLACICKPNQYLKSPKNWLAKNVLRFILEITCLIQNGLAEHFQKMTHTYIYIKTYLNKTEEWEKAW